MSLISRLSNLLPSTIQTLPERVTYSPSLTSSEMRIIGNDITIYPQDGGERYIDKGYKRNDGVYSIVSRNAEKCGQVRLYHVKVKRDERQTAKEYLQITKGSINEKVLKEATKMRKAMIEDLVVDSSLSKLLNKPNRYQSQDMWIENLVGLKELQGEGNLWFNIGVDGKKPIEMLIIPKSQLNLVGNGRDPWTVVRYEFVLDGNTYQWETDKVLMWRYSNPCHIDNTMEHLRGMAPLEAFVVQMQGMNEGDLRAAISNKNGGAAGLAYREDVSAVPTVEQMTDMRRQFNNSVNSNEMAGKIAIQAGKWGYHSFATTFKDQQLLEQYNIGFKRLCRVFKTPAGIFDESNDTYNNQRAYERRWIYSKIAPMMYSLRSHLNDTILSKFDLDPERNIIDCDIMSLQELSTDLSEQVTALKDAYWLTPNQKRDASGYEKSVDENMDKYYFPSGLTPLDQLNEPIGGNLNNEVNLLNGGK